MKYCLIANKDGTLASFSLLSREEAEKIASDRDKLIIPVCLKKSIKVPISDFGKINKIIKKELIFSLDNYKEGKLRAKRAWLKLDKIPPNLLAFVEEKFGTADKKILEPDSKLSLCLYWENTDTWAIGGWAQWSPKSQEHPRETIKKDLSILRKLLERT